MASNLLSDVLAETALAMRMAAEARGKARKAHLATAAELWAEAEGIGFPHVDDNVDLIRLVVAGSLEAKGETYLLRDAAAKLNVLVRCAEWVEAAEGKFEESKALAYAQAVADRAYDHLVKHGATTLNDLAEALREDPETVHDALNDSGELDPRIEWDRAMGWYDIKGR